MLFWKAFTLCVGLVHHGLLLIELLLADGAQRERH